MTRPELISEFRQRWIGAFTDHETFPGVQPDRIGRSVAGEPKRNSDCRGYKKPKDKLRRIVKAILLDLFPPPEGPPASMKLSTIVEEVNKVIVKHGLWPKPAAGITVRRALRELSKDHDRANAKAEGA